VVERISLRVQQSVGRGWLESGWVRLDYAAAAYGVHVSVIAPQKKTCECPLGERTMISSVTPPPDSSSLSVPFFLSFFFRSTEIFKVLYLLEP
jgi:hypothetical protein